MAYVSILKARASNFSESYPRRPWLSGRYSNQYHTEGWLLFHLASGNMNPTIPKLHFAAATSDNDAQELQRQYKAGMLLQLAEGIYASNIPTDQLAVLVRRHWQQVAGAIALGGVISHLSAMKGGVLETGVLVLSHPTYPEGEVLFPGKL
ncbi:hypothetical protein [Herbaspirillum frisingense]|uniref:Uncharacterized protein n=1 Tax=Herbaspirillum frisingense TaxID=92645 RepID=A0ABU1PEI8_9BURK|nr:hypothetical protein [Herbaspirillum frisingense]MDR6584336.1 hypothetical protein [Herbaspirillum frisingense]